MGKLVLGRTVGQSLLLKTESGEEIAIDFLKVKGDTYRVAIECPKSVDIIRGELLNR